MATFVENINKLADSIPDNLGSILDQVQADLLTKQDKETGKGLSSNDYTTQEKDKLSGIADSANNYTHPATHPVNIIDGSANPSQFVKTDVNGVTSFGSVSWGEVGGKPTEFTPTSHTHLGTDINSIDWSQIVNEPQAYTPTSHHHDMTDVVTGNLSATRITQTDSLNFVTNDEKDIINGAELAINKGANGGYAPLDMAGKIPTAYMPSISVIDVFTVTSEAEMLALPASAGDIALRQDLNTQFMLQSVPATSIDNWVQLVSQASVTSVNGQTGIVNLSTGDISETTNLYYTQARVRAEIAAAHDTVGSFMNKTIDDASNFIGANHIHYKIKATENLAVGDVLKIVGFNAGEDAIRVAKTTLQADTAIGVCEQSLLSGEFGLATNTGTIDGIDTSAWTFGTILYSGGMGDFTAIKPADGTYQACAYVMRQNANNGSLLVEFTEPRDVYLNADISSLVV